MKKYFLVLTIAAAVALPASPAFSQQMERPPAKEGHEMRGQSMQGGGMMMCPMMGMGGMGMMGGMMGSTGGDPSMMGRMMEMRGEMMMKMGEVMMKHGKLMQKGDTK